MWRETPPWSIFTSTEGINYPPLPLIFSSIFLVFFYHISAFFFAPCLEKFIITAGLKEKKSWRKHSSLKFDDLPKLSCLMQIYSDHSGGGDVFVSFSSWHPDSHFMACRRHQKSWQDPRQATQHPQTFTGENLDWFGSVTSHILMKNFKPELFSYELEVGQHMKNHESGVSDSFFYVVLFLLW